MDALQDATLDNVHREEVQGWGLQTPQAGEGEANCKGGLARRVGRKPRDQDSLALGFEQVPKVIGTLSHGELLRVKWHEGTLGTLQIQAEASLTLISLMHIF